jgi:branched-chain amino acid transport system permease protein
MAALVGPIVFVIVVVGGMGSLAGAFVASLLIGCMQTFSVSLDWSLAGLFSQFGWTVTSQTPLAAIWNVKLSQAAPVLPYLLMVLLLIFRPRGLMGTREG